MIPLPDGKHHLIVCDLQAVATPQPRLNSLDFDPGRFNQLPSRLLLVPWGNVDSKSGNFTINDLSFQSMRSEMERHGVDIPIDYEHQTLGGEYSGPGGRAPAAGWIKRLTHLPGKGIYGDVSWTASGARDVFSNQYRYFSPVVNVRKVDGVAIGLHSVALTNRPAIVSMPTITSSAPPPGTVPNSARSPVKPEIRLASMIPLCHWGVNHRQCGGDFIYDERSIRYLNSTFPADGVLIDIEHACNDLQNKTPGLPGADVRVIGRILSLSMKPGEMLLGNALWFSDAHEVAKKKPYVSGVFRIDSNSRFIGAVEGASLTDNPAIAMMPVTR